MTLSISIALILVLLLTCLVSPACLAPTHLDGLCQACPPNQILIAGFCLPPILGCLSQLSPNVCGTCQAGWVLTRNLCVSSNSNNPPPLNSLSSLETYSDDAPDLKYQLLDFYFKKKYLTQLVDKISNVSMAYHLKTTYGDIYALTYSNPFSNAATIYRAEGMVSSFNNVTEYRFLTITLASINDYSALLWFIDRKVIVDHLTSLHRANLNQVQQLSDNQFRFFYITFQGAIYVKDVQRNNASSTSSSFPSLTQLYYQINQNTVINYVFSLFPRLQMYTTYFVNYYTITDTSATSRDYYKFVFDSQIIVVVQINGLNLILFSYQEPDNVVNLPSSPSSVAGGYLPLLNLNDPTYLQAKQLVIQSYPFLNNKIVESVRYQVVSGINFMIEFNNDPFSADSYLVTVFIPLGTGTPTINQLYRSGIDVKNNLMPTAVPGSFNYEADPTFRALYSFFRQPAKATLKNVLPISSVQYVVNANKSIDYLVVYTAAEYAYLRFTPNVTASFQILSYKVFGIEMSLAGALPQTATRSAIISLLQQQKPTLFSISILIHLYPGLDVEDQGYEVDILTQFGTYYTRIYQQQGLLYLSTITQTSPATCSDLSPSEMVQNPVVSSLNSFVLQNYPQVVGSYLSLAQGYISSATGAISYRLVLAKQSQRYEVQASIVNGQYMVNKLTLLDGTGCNQMSVRVAGLCSSQCASFAF